MSTQNNLISICIPTYNRPELLQEAILSCFSQSYRPLEIVISDNSDRYNLQDIIDQLVPPQSIELRYHRNQPPVSPADNVNRLFDTARGGRLLLLHDDDLLCAGGLDDLVEQWDAHPNVRCVYGKPEIIDHDGHAMPRDTSGFNSRYYRTAQYAGPQTSGLEAGLRQQIPINGFLVETALARTIRYRAYESLGSAVDADFGIRLGAAVQSGAFIFVDKFVSKYRISQDSILRAKSVNHGYHLFYKALQGVTTSTSAEAVAKGDFLDRSALDASLDAAMSGERSLCLKIMLSKHYKASLFSRWTGFRLLVMAFPRFAMLIANPFRHR